MTRLAASGPERSPPRRLSPTASAPVTCTVALCAMMAAKAGCVSFVSRTPLDRPPA